MVQEKSSWFLVFSFKFSEIKKGDILVFERKVRFWPVWLQFVKTVVKKNALNCRFSLNL